MPVDTDLHQASLPSNLSLESASGIHRKQKQVFPGGTSGKNMSANAGDVRDARLSPIPELARSPGERCGNPLQYFCLENPTDRGAW